MSLIGTGQYIRRNGILSGAEKVKDRVSEFDLSKLRAIANTIGGRVMNLKHFLGIMRLENIFNKFNGP